MCFLFLTLGRLLAFKYIDGRTKKDRRYIKQTVSVEPETDFENRKIEALAVWYKCTETGKLLITDDNNSCFKSTENYLATVTEDPSKNDAGLFFKQEFMNKFSTDLLEIKVSPKLYVHYVRLLLMTFYILILGSI